jgi:hypothetical protein
MSLKTRSYATRFVTRLGWALAALHILRRFGIQELRIVAVISTYNSGYIEAHLSMYHITFLFIWVSESVQTRVSNANPNPNQKPHTASEDRSIEGFIPVDILSTAQPIITMAQRETLDPGDNH